MSGHQLQQLLEAGQSVWLDNLRRGMFASGELQALIDKGLRGMTSNPTIFEKAIGAGNDYDDQLRSLIGKQRDASALFWDLAIQDIQSACDLFRKVYDESGGNDGFVSLEVSPLLAHDTQGTIDMAKDLWKRLNRPNLMVKIPGTNEGVPAIEECIAEGININVTLIFAIEMYEKTTRAFIRGLQRRMDKGQDVSKVRSVNSVFVSRIDTAVDKLLEARIDKGEKQLENLLGKAGTANLKLTYQKFLEICSSDEWKAVAAKGARPQRPLWASTSTKNPKYFDLMYIEPVVGRDTVNTMPPQTLDALLDHGTVVPDTVLKDLDEARATVKQTRRREHLALRGDVSAASGRRPPVQRLVRRAARRHRLQTETTQFRRRARFAFAGPLFRRVFERAQRTGRPRLPEEALGKRRVALVNRPAARGDH